MRVSLIHLSGLSITDSFTNCTENKYPQCYYDVTLRILYLCFGVYLFP